MVMFFLIATSIWAAAHVYVGRRLLWPFPPRVRRIGWAVVVVLFLLSPAVMWLRREDAGSGLFSAVRWAGYTYMGLFTLMFVLTLVRDLAGGLLRLKQFAGKRVLGVRGDVVAAMHEPAAMQEPPVDPERRLFLGRVGSASVMTAAGVLGGAGVHDALRIPDVEEVEVPIEGLPRAFDGYRIAQLSDIHVGPTIKGDFLRAVVEKVNALRPDAVGVTGDLVDGYVHQLKDQVAPLGDLRARDGAFFVTGNHEYYWNVDEWVAYVRSLGLTVLDNEHRVVRRGDAALVLSGVPDLSIRYRINDHISDPALALEGAPEDAKRILFAHQPRSIHQAAEAGYDLQLCGHTHGGQFFPWNLVVGFAHPFARGLDRLQKTWIYVNRGTGYWGPPIRTGVPSEITLLTLRRA